MQPTLAPADTRLPPLVPGADTTSPSVHIIGVGHYLWADSTDARLQALCPSLQIKTMPLPVYPVRMRSTGTRVQVFGKLWQVLFREGWRGKLVDLCAELFARGITAWHMGKRAQNNKGVRGGKREMAMRAKAPGEATVRLWLRAMTDELLVPIGYVRGLNGIIRDRAEMQGVIANVEGRADTLVRRASAMEERSLAKGGWVDLVRADKQHQWTCGDAALDRKAQRYAAEVPLTRDVEDRKDTAVAERLGITVDELRLQWKGPLRDVGFPACSGRGNWIAATDEQVTGQGRRMRRRGAHERYNVGRFCQASRCWVTDPDDAEIGRAHV